MLFSEYVADLQKVIAEFSQSGLLLHSEVNADMRTEHIGLLKGILNFADSSTLFFKEYLDLHHAVDKKMYSFHYQDAQGMLRFRYDDAAHKPPLGFQNHKHTTEETVASSMPVLSDVLNEIFGYLTDSY